MSDDTKAIVFATIVAIINVIKIAIFAWLAVYFDKWGIVLLSALFMSSFSSKDKESEEDQTNGE